MARIVLKACPIPVGIVCIDLSVLIAHISEGETELEYVLDQDISKGFIVVLRKLTDPDEIRRFMESAKAHDEAQEVKLWARVRGYVWSMSFYGVLTDEETGRSSYRRIEVLSDVFWSGRIVELIYRWFQKVKPVETYSIWIYDSEKDALRLLDQWR